MPSSEHRRHQQQPAAGVVLMCGLPGSGKSAFAAAMMRHINSNSNSNSNSDNQRIHGEASVDHPVGRYYDQIVLIDYDEIADNITVSTETPTCTTGGTRTHLASAGPSSSTTCDKDEDSAVPSDAEAEASSDAIFSEEDLQAWRDCRNIALSRLEKELRRYFSSFDPERTDNNDIGTTAARNLLIILDDNFYLRSMRRDVYRVCQRVISDISDNIGPANGTASNPCGIGFSVFMVDAPMDTCLKRNALRKGKARIPEATVQKMASTLERPEPNSGAYTKKFETNSIVLDNTEDWTGELQGAAHDDNNNDWHSLYGDAIRACLDAAIKNPVVPPQREEEVDPEVLRKAREETKKNRIHQADRLLRSLVGVVGRADKSMGRIANDARKHVLQQVRDEVLPVGVVDGCESSDDDSTYQVEIANSFKSYLEKNETCRPARSSKVFTAIDEALHKLT